MELIQNKINFPTLNQINIANKEKEEKHNYYIEENPKEESNDFTDNECNPDSKNNIKNQNKNKNISFLTPNDDNIQIKNISNKNEINLEETKIVKQKNDFEKNRYPYCIVWTPLPYISLLFPFIGHTGICR